MTGWHKVYIGVGSNMGDSYKCTIEAFDRLSEMDKIVLADHSSLYWTDPVGTIPQPRFLNSVVLVYTHYPPDTLLIILKNTEKQLGRNPGSSGQPRLIDLDILFYDQLVLSTAELVIPHPRVYQRLFTLVPLMEIAPFFQHKTLKLPLKYYVEKFANELLKTQKIRRAYEKIPGKLKSFVSVQNNKSQVNFLNG